MSYYTGGRYYPPVTQRGQMEKAYAPERTSVIGQGLVIVGVIQILIGLLAFLIAIYRIVGACQLGSIATGTWVGAFIMILGVLAIIAGQSRDEKSLTTVTVLSFLSMFLALVLLSIEGVALNREMSNCDPIENACVPLCFFASTSLVFIGLFEFSFCFATSIMAINVTRRTVKTGQPVLNTVEPSPKWAVPSIYEMNHRQYNEELLARRMALEPLPPLGVRSFDHSTQTNVPRHDEDRYRFP
ncbi:uncharacterized protein [Apostichopus japonicus]|uniref:uncharacterized protein isoform X2 n=1 Tax=Stichopus japonicus TaxID=307972 RepID=UPI003AB18C5F